MNTGKNYSTAILVNKSPGEVYKAINDPRGWWQGKIEGNTNKLNEAFTYEMEGVHYSKQKIAELVPGKKVVWLIIDSNLRFVNDPHEWTNTEIEFDIAEEDDETKLTFTHKGLVPSFECYNSCSGAWTDLICKSLFSYITTGKGVQVF